jgi:hypothetical protein
MWRQWEKIPRFGENGQQKTGLMHRTKPAFEFIY